VTGQGRSRVTGVGGGTRSGGAWLRLRHATSTRPSSSPPSCTSLTRSFRRLAAAAAAATAAADSRPPPLTRISFCSPSRRLFPSLSLPSPTTSYLPSFLPSVPGWTCRVEIPESPHCLCSLRQRSYSSLS
jgi:hypothetical protein